MQLARRGRQRFTAPALLWLLLTALCAIAGPFGTHQAMGLSGRLAYWAFVVAISILGSMLMSRFDPKHVVASLMLWAGYSAVLAGAIFALNTVLFPPTVIGRDLLSLVVIIAVSVVAINGMVYLARQTLGETPVAVDPASDPEVKFLRRVPLETRGPLVRIEAQDHYLNVVTTKGTALILLRLAEAVEELEGAGGMQTHRSHWVKVDAVQGHRRTGGRDVLVMSDGSTVPVARTRRDAVRAAGLF